MIISNIREAKAEIYEPSAMTFDFPLNSKDIDLIIRPLVEDFLKQVNSSIKNDNKKTVSAPNTIQKAFNIILNWVRNKHKESTQSMTPENYTLHTLKYMLIHGFIQCQGLNRALQSGDITNADQFNNYWNIEYNLKAQIPPREEWVEVD